MKTDQSIVLSKMLLKVCGMRDRDNIIDLLALKPDFIGFIFYEKSSRNVSNTLDASLLSSFPTDVKKVGVFVNATLEFIQKNVDSYHLDYIQLHGNESVQFCQDCAKMNLKIIKAFSVDGTFDLRSTIPFEHLCEYFLFDTKGINHGGNGTKFDWNILKTNSINKSFFLSGGLELEDLNSVWELKNSQKKLIAIDVNSKFERSPAFKDIEKLKLLKQRLNESNNT